MQPVQQILQTMGAGGYLTKTHHRRRPLQGMHRPPHPAELLPERRRQLHRLDHQLLQRIQRPVDRHQMLLALLPEDLVQRIRLVLRHL